ncbi:MAG: CorA family divalent cation transporter [Chitinophagales bacterium]|nr:CorA family divalent cation transporter [Chitinophagales bacterium]
MSTAFSHHHFMFPFRWDILPANFREDDIKENISFDRRTNLESESIPDEFGKWKRKQFAFRNEEGKFEHKYYNEFTYYHEYVSKAIYDFSYPWKHSQGVLKYFEYDIKENSTYKINIIEDKGNRFSLTLQVDGISLHLYNTGVGVLSFNLSNVLESQNNADAILQINEFGRRIYPQFMTENGNLNCKYSFMPDTIELNIEDTPIVEDYAWYDNDNIYLTSQIPYQLPKHITTLFPSNFIFELNGVLSSEKILLTKITDDRMFFFSWYGNNEITKKIADDFSPKGEITDDWLYAYIFGDKEKKSSIANPFMQKKQLEDHTYTRWIGLKTIYGINRDSFVCLSDTEGFPRVHMQTIYYNLLVLCLVQRASILKFTAEVANLADLAKVEKDKQVVANIKEIYKNYIEFINKIHFREISPQIQGIELYNLIQKHNNTEVEIKDLDNEIGELHQYVSLIQDSERNEEAAKLNKLAIFFLPFTVVFGILGANFLEQGNFPGLPSQAPWTWIVYGSLISIVVSGIIYLFNELNKK